MSFSLFICHRLYIDIPLPCYFLLLNLNNLDIFITIITTRYQHQFLSKAETSRTLSMSSILSNLAKVRGFKGRSNYQS